MSTNETDIDKLYRELDNHNQSIVVTSDIKDIVLIPHAIYTIKTFLYK